VERRRFLAMMTAALLPAPLAAEAQQPGGRLPRVGYLGSGYPSDRSSPQFSHLFEAFGDGLRENGYVDGQTVAIEYRWAEERYEPAPGRRAPVGGGRDAGPRLELRSATTWAIAGMLRGRPSFAQAISPAAGVATRLQMP
jgi:hypothetical protein